MNEDRVSRQRPLEQRRTALFVAILTVGLVAAGCGGSSSSSRNTSTTAALTKPQFLKQGNAICEKGNQQINAAAQKLFGKKNKQPSKADATKFATDTLIPSIQSSINGLKALGAPKGDEAKVNAIITSAQAALDKFKKDPALVASNTAHPFKQSNKLARDYGLNVCGSAGA